MGFQSINPATEKLLADYPVDTPAQVERKLIAANKAFQSWRFSDFSERSMLMMSLSNLLQPRQETLAALITAEMGKPIAQSQAEIQKCADACEFFAGHAEEMLKSEDIESDASHSCIRYEPLGALRQQRAKLHRRQALYC